MHIELRLEEPGDFRRVEEITREAFWNLHVPGCQEHFLAHQLRQSRDFIAELDMVALVDGELVGNIMYTHAEIRQGEAVAGKVVCFGPVSVLPEWQGKGIGGALIRRTLAEAARMGFGAVLIYGDPAYYQRFGFRATRAFGITTPDGRFVDPLMGLELREGALAGITGSFHESQDYEMDPAAFEVFERGFPPKVKAVTESQKRFAELIASGSASS
mgnify:CR=1 FL=1